MARINMDVTIRPPQNILDRNAEAFCSSPATNLRDFVFSNANIDNISNCVMLEYDNDPAVHLWGKANYHCSPSGSDSWIESQNPLGREGKAVGWSGTPLNTTWAIYTTQDIDELRGVQVSILWHRRAESIAPNIEIFPRMDLSHTTTINGHTYWFCPFLFEINSQNMFVVREYPYDDLTYFETAADTSLLKEVFSKPLVISPTDFGSKWMKFWIQPLSESDVLIRSNVIEDGGFVYRSALERTNISMFPSGPAGVRSISGGLSQVQIVPTDYEDSGSFTSDIMTKQEANAEYPTVSVFGWSKSTSFMDNQTIPAGGSVGGISFKIIDPDTGLEIPSTDTPVFQSFKYQIAMTPTDNTTPVVNDVICDFGQSTAVDSSTPIDVTDNVISIEESESEELGGYRATVVIHNPDGIYNNIALRPANEIDFDFDGVDRAVMYTLNPMYELYRTPTDGALTLKWECGDGFELLKNAKVIGHPPYDGMLVSEAIIEFAKRIGIPESRIDVAETTGVYLPNKRHNEEYQFQPSDGSSAFDFIKQLQEWFASTWTIRFSGDGKLTLENTSSVVIARTFYLSSTSGQHSVYKGAEVELLHDQFYNEIVVCGYDPRTGKTLYAPYINKPSQSDPSAEDYVGKRNLAIVNTVFNSQAILNWLCAEYVKYFGVIRARIKFKTKFDVNLRPGNYIKLNEFASVWKITGISTTMDEKTASETGDVHDCSITAIQWPVTV